MAGDHHGPLGEEIAVEGAHRPQARQRLGIAVPHHGAGIAPETDGLDPERAEHAGFGLAKRSAIAGRAEAHLCPRASEIDQVDPIGAEIVHEIEQQRVRVETLVGQVAEVPVRPLPGISASARAEEDEGAQLRMPAAHAREVVEGREFA